MSFFIAIFRLCTILEVMETQIGATLVGQQQFNVNIFCLNPTLRCIYQTSGQKWKGIEIRHPKAKDIRLYFI